MQPVGNTISLSPHLILRTFKVQSSSNESFTVKQLHYTGWPDHGVPSGDSQESF